MHYTTTNEQETKDLAATVLRELGADHVLLLRGDLGSGKTTFVKGIGSALGVVDVVTSPTFTLMNVYQVSHERFDRLVHVDLYRLESVSSKDMLELGLQEYVTDSSSLVIIEWPERLTCAVGNQRTLLFRVEGTSRIIQFA